MGSFIIKPHRRMRMSLYSYIHDYVVSKSQGIISLINFCFKKICVLLKPKYNLYTAKHFLTLYQ